LSTEITPHDRADAAPLPAVVWVPAAFFLVAGLADFALSWRDMSAPRAFWPVWEALGRTIMHGLLAAGLLRRSSLCRSIAMVYCLASIATYAVALGLAWAHAPVRFPDSVVLQSLLQVPSCALLLPFLRSPQASAAYTRPWF
jgi:hypothetical protein